MLKNGILLVLGVLVLFIFTARASAKTKIIDVIYLTDGSVVTGKIIEKIPDEIIKIKITDGNKLLKLPYFSYSVDQIEKMDKVKVEFKSRTVATLFAVVGPLFTVLPIFQGYGQLYNGQYLKAAGFFLNGFAGITLFLNSGLAGGDGGLGAGMVLGGYIWSIADANQSAEKINQLSNQKVNELKLKNDQPKDVPISLNLNYIPHEGMMASYSFGF